MIDFLPIPPAAYMVTIPAFPTILVAHCSCGSDALVKNLRQQGYHVLEAKDAIETVEIARVHSRPIHLMLTDESTNSRSLAATLKQYRPHMSVLFITPHATIGVPNVLSSDKVLAKIRASLEPPSRAIAAGS